LTSYHQDPLWSYQVEYAFS